MAVYVSQCSNALIKHLQNIQAHGALSSDTLSKVVTW